MRFFWGQSFSMIDFQPYKQFLVKPLKDRFSFRGVSVCYLATLAKNSLSRTTSRALKGVWGGQKKKTEKKNKNKTFIWIGSEIQICRTCREQALQKLHERMVWCFYIPPIRCTQNKASTMFCPQREGAGNLLEVNHRWEVVWHLYTQLTHLK